ncbi:MAG: GNAT family N-acetyltransferase, partial [Bacteroidota bacterium]
NAHPDVLRFTGDAPFKDVDMAEQFISGYDTYRKTGMGRWVIEILDTEEPVGWSGIKFHEDENLYDLGYRILHRFWNKGIATEAAIGCLNWIKGKEIKTVLSCVHQENHSSLRVSEKLGFKYAYERYYGETPWLIFEKSII